MVNKKIIFWAIGSIALGGLSYFVYRKIADRNKDFVKDGTFTIVIDNSIEADSTQNTMAASVPEYEEPEIDDSSIDYSDLTPYVDPNSDYTEENPVYTV